MANIGWDESTPADTESLALGDDRLRSLKTSLRQGLDTEHLWPSAGGDAGVHRVGSARAYVGTQSQVSSSGTDGKLMWASDSSKFFHVGSAGTVYLGGPTVISLDHNAVSYPQRSHFVEEMDTATLNSSGSATVVIPNSGYSGLPFVFLSQYTTGPSNPSPGASVLNLAASTFMIYHTLGSSASGTPVFWRSIGSRSL